MNGTDYVSKTASAAIIAAAVLFFCDYDKLPLIVIAVLCHELTHCIAVIICGGKITGIYASGFGLVLNTAGLSYASEAISALAGPVGGFLLAFMASDVYLAGVSAALSFFNLLPIYPLDGGRAMYAIFCSFFDYNRASKYSIRIGNIFCIMFLISGAAVLIFEKSAALLLSAVWVSIYYCKNTKSSIKYNHKSLWM